MVTWGFDCYGGDSSEVAAELARGVVEVVAVSKKMFTARKDDGSVVEWGRESFAM